MRTLAALGAASIALTGCAANGGGSSGGGGDNKTVVVYDSKSNSETETTKATNAAFEAATGIKVEVKVLPGDPSTDYPKNRDITLQNGGDGDVVFMGNDSTMSKYATSGLLLPLNDLIDSSGDDVEAKYGDYLANATVSNGDIMGLPTESNLWGVYYNKKIFDDAGVEYPTGEWTWDDYTATAKKLTDPAAGVYGSYMLDYDNYFFGYASQMGVSAYTEDGESNYDDPAFAEALEFYGDLGNVEKIQPSYLDYTSNKISYDAFMGGDYGMMYISSWFLGLFANSTDYPRDWKFGIAQAPTPADADSRLNLAATGFYGVVENGKNHDAAYEYVKFQADEAYKTNGRIPARVDLQGDDLSAVFAGTVEQAGNDVTVTEVTDALFDNGMGLVSEKIVGPGDAQYSEIILNHGQQYLLGTQSLDDAVSDIKSEADIAIETAKQAG